ncbi:hypothetical protein BC830DRAFT_732124 [Chytriomyces sp. MP71]|nr:hypothetical protein BC830DRAFT_732124 [Chytriomyces sp. MP71]
MGGPPPPPPPPGMGGAPPPPPAASAAQAADPNDLFAAIRGGLKLKKVSPPKERDVKAALKEPEVSPEEKARLAKQKEEEERSALLIELLGHMETSSGNLEELTVKAAKSTSVARGFIYTLHRREFVDAFRSKESLPEGGRKEPAQVYQGIEVNRAIKLKDRSETEVKDVMESGGVVARVHMYRFDDKAQTHTLDEIVMLKGRLFPKPLPPFSEPAPVKDGSRMAMNAYDAWEARKDEYKSRDYFQFELNFKKLMDQDIVTVQQMKKLEQTQIAMRRMAESLSKQFEHYTTPELKEVVESIPKQIKEFREKLEEQSGVILRGEALESIKLTPAFIMRNSKKSKALVEAEAALQRAAEEEARQREEEERVKGLHAVVDTPVWTYKNLLERVAEAKETGAIEKVWEQASQQILSDEEDEKEVIMTTRRMQRLRTVHAGVKHRGMKFNEV